MTITNKQKNNFSQRKKPSIKKTYFEEIFIGKGNILLMDDDENIRIVTGEVLTSLGYDVSLSKDGGEAIELYKKAIEGNNPFDVIILDLVIPGGMGGKDTINRIREINPSVKAILSSGSYDDPVMMNYKKYGFTAIVPKPYTVHQLSKNLYKVIKGLI